MKAWNFKLKSNPQEISKRLNSSLGSGNGFAFNMDDTKKEFVTFNVRKRILYGYQVLLRNHIKVNGKIFENNVENESNVEISFNQHFLTVFYVLMFLISGIVAIIVGLFSNMIAILYGVGLLVIGIALWLDVNRRYKKDIQQYKTLIGNILEI